MNNGEILKKMFLFEVSINLTCQILITPNPHLNFCFSNHGILYKFQYKRYIFLQWCPPTIFGTAWSLLSTSMNVAGTFGPLITAYFIAHVGWKESMTLAGEVSWC